MTLTRKRHFNKNLNKYSDPKQAQKMAYKYLGKTAKLYPAHNKTKKYSIWDPKKKNGLVLVKLVMKIILNIMIRIDDITI